MTETTRLDRRAFMTALLAGAVVAGCKGKTNAPDAAAPSAKLELPDGVYLAAFRSDSAMFHMNEACKGKGRLVVRDGVGTFVFVAPSKNVVRLFPGKAADAAKQGAALVEPGVTTVVYEDGATEEVHSFEIPVPVLDKDFDLALLGTKGVWYDHRARVSAPEPIPDDAPATTLEPGEYAVPVSLEGGSGRGALLSPATVVVDESGARVTLEWNSPFYDYMIVAGQKYEPTNAEGNATFALALPELPPTLPATADSVAMSRPHEIEYTILFDLNAAEKKERPAE